MARYNLKYDTFADFGAAIQRNTGVSGDPEDIGRRFFDHPKYSAITVREATDPSLREPDRLLGLGPDLNAMQRGLEGRLPVGDETLAQVLPANVLKNLASVPVETLKVLNSPIESGKELFSVAKGAAKDAYGPAQKYLQGIEDQDPDIEKKREMVEGAKQMFTDPDQIIRRPLDPLLTLFGGASTPVRAAARLMPGQTSRNLSVLEDPGLAMLKEGGRQTVRAGKVAAKKLKEKTPKVGITDWGKRRGSQVLDLGLGKTTATSDLTMQRIRTAPGEGRGRLVSAYAEGGLKAKENLVKHAHRAIDIVNRHVDDFQSGVSKELAPHYKAPIEPQILEDLKKEARANLRRAEARVTETSKSTWKPGRPGAEGPPWSWVPTRKADISFEEFPHEQATAVASRGPSQDIIIDTHKRLLEADTSTVGALQRFMWQIDDDISVLGSDMGQRGRRHMIELRGKIRQALSDQLPEIYDTATRAYEEAMQYKFNAQILLHVEPGKISKTGVLREVNEPAVEAALLDAMDDADSFAYRTLTDLEKGSGVKLQHRIAGVAAQPKLAESLAVTASTLGHARQALRVIKSPVGLMRAGGTVGTMAFLLDPILGATSGLLMSVVYSPKLMKRILIDTPPHLRETKRKGFKFARKAFDGAAKYGVPVSQWVQDMVPLEVALERLANAEFQGRIDAPTNEQVEQDSILKTTAGLPIAQPTSGPGPSKLSFPRVQKYQSMIDSIAKENEIPPELVAAVIQAESGGDPNAKSDAGAVGLMQLMPVHGVKDRRDPEQNIAAGTKYLKELIDEFGSIEDALWAYNAGPTALKEGRKPEETKNYIPKVMDIYNRLRGAS
jgi:hypothetical protein